MTDYYEVLGVARDATPGEIKSAFRRLAQQVHPDVCGDREGAEGRFMRILEAYEILGDPEKRRAFDLSLASGSARGRGDFDIGDFSRLDELEDLLTGELLETLLGRRGRGGPARGKDLRYDIELTLEEAFSGASRQVTAPRTETCTECSGTGAAAGGRASPCPVCNGLGQVKGVRARGASKFVTVESCPRCLGKGKIIQGECGSCGGRGKRRIMKPVTVFIPAGVGDGAVLRMPGEGAEGTRGGPGGDLYLVVRVKPHARFTRDGPDLKCTREISFPLAALGGILRVPTLDGAAALEVPAGTQSHTVFHLHGLGMPGYGSSGRGDLLVTVVVKVPGALTEKMRSLLAEMEVPGGAARPRRRRWWRR
jgi:molecular chaperone DnaJ